jgi:hypothetical protein
VKVYLRAQRVDNHATVRLRAAVVSDAMPRDEITQKGAHAKPRRRKEEKSQPEHKSSQAG